MLFLLLIGPLFHGGGAQHICQWTFPLSDVDRSLFVEIHNTYRAYVARGEAYQLGDKLPGSPGLFELKYDCQLELMAHMNTYSCNQTFHPPTTSINYFTIVNEPHAWSKRDLIPLAASNWYQPILDIRNKSDPRLESFANMMYYKSLSIGCSHNLCPATATTPAINAIACLYTPALQRNELIYPEDHYGCVDDADCWKYGTPSSRCITEGPYHGLCAQDSSRATTTTIAFSTAPSTSTTTVPSTTQSTTPDSSPATTTTIAFSTTPSTSTTTVVSATRSTTPVIPENRTCLFVGDMYNFGLNHTAYDQEKRFIYRASMSIFESTTEFSAGLSVYGYVHERFPNAGLNDMRTSSYGFSDELLLNRMFIDDDDYDLTTEEAIKILNKSRRMNEVNCVIFFSAQRDTTALPALLPTRLDARIVAVGFDATDLTGIVKENGIAVSVPYDFTAQDVRNVVDAVLS